METEYLHDIENLTEHAILKLLKTKGTCLYGDIFKFLSDRLIRFPHRTSIIEFNIELK